jgi:superfamily II DNA or RNA helicase
MIKISPHNASFIKVYCEDFGVEQELSEFFTFFASSYKYAPAFKSGMWDGKIRLFNMRTKSLYKGLLDVVIRFAKLHDYPIDVHPSLNNKVDISLESVEQYMKSLNMCSRGQPVELRDYQISAVHDALSHNRSIQVAATSSGKSLMIYSMIRWNMLRDRKTLLIVPNINLVKQMFSDFAEYSAQNGWVALDNVHVLYGGKERVFQAPVIISTWQTLMSMMKDDKARFKELTDCVDVMIGDEAHTFKSTEVSKIIEAFVNTETRIGTTGTLDSVQLNILTLTGLFGPPHQVVTARELIDAGQATEVDIRIMVLKHPEEIRKAFKGMDYKEEIGHMMACEARNIFIARLALACKGNTLILYNYVQKHGNLIHEKLQELVGPGRNIYYIHGGVDADVREQIRQIVGKEKDAIMLATSSLMSTGTNIPSIANLIFGMPGKSDTRLRQSIGRGIRLDNGKYLTRIFDIADNYSWKSWKNTAMKHLDERIKVYSKEEHPMKVIDVELKY